MHIPEIMRVEITNICNETCEMCPYKNMKRSKGFIDISLFKKVIKDHSSLVKNPKLILPANVGEPFLDDRIFEFIDFASRYYKDISVFTNSSLLNSQRINQILESHISELMLTLHGLFKDDFIEITGYNNYGKVKNNIYQLCILNSQLKNPKKIYLDIYVKNMHDAKIDPFVQKLSKITELNVIPFSKMHNWGGKIGNYNNFKREYCNRLGKQFGVLHDGSIVPCCADVEGEYVLGNVNSSSLIDIFNSTPYKTLIQKNSENALSQVELCNKCNIDLVMQMDS